MNALRNGCKIVINEVKLKFVLLSRQLSSLIIITS